MIILQYISVFIVVGLIIMALLFVIDVTQYVKLKLWWRKQLTDLLSLFIALFTFCIGSVVFFVTFIIGIFYTIFKHLIKKDFSLKKIISPIFRVVTLLFDGLANAGSGELLNNYFKPVVKFGKWYQTISAIVGINYLHNKKNNIVNKRIDKFHDVLNNVLGANHCENAITANDVAYYRL